VTVFVHSVSQFFHFFIRPELFWSRKTKSFVLVYFTLQKLCFDTGQSFWTQFPDKLHRTVKSQFSNANTANMVFSTHLSYLGLDPVTVLLVLLGYVVLRSVYRLTLHPLAKFPGPRPAAVSSMYGASYDLPKNSSYVKMMPALHDKYGPLGWLVTAIFSPS
jgi:hypothetical protein